LSRRSDWLLSQLPMGMLDDEFFVRFVSLFQELATSLLEDADNIPNVVDLTVAPAELVRWLGSWLAITSIDASLPEELQRALVREVGRDLAWRGTRRGLEGFLRVLTGAPVEITESGSITRAAEDDEGNLVGRGPRSVAIRVESVGWLAEDDFVALVADEIPANVDWSIHLGERELKAALATAGSELGA
jgi:phage tail-like protein